jgi:hypothetical protein
MHAEGIGHVPSGVDAGVETKSIAFEDLTGGGDRDDEDVACSVARLWGNAMGLA